MSGAPDVQSAASKGLDVRISIHDVMPDTLAATTDILKLLKEKGAGPVQLLVVPGLDWPDEGLAQLRLWQDEGHELVGHGWVHKASQIRGVKHRLHSLLISRDVAEHLSLDESGVINLLSECHEWFVQKGLRPPTFYVPPAWALGKIARHSLSGLPFTQIETLGGVLDCQTGRQERQYLVGFEADTLFRKYTLRVFNAANVAMARLSGRPLRIAIHPQDLKHHLAADVARLVALG